MTERERLAELLAEIEAALADALELSSKLKDLAAKAAELLARETRLDA